MKKVKEDTARIFVDVQLDGTFGLSSTAVINYICHNSSLTEHPSRLCLQAQENSRGADADSLLRLKSADATMQTYPHPKAIYSTMQPALIFPNPHSGVEAYTPYSSISNPKSRPDKLSLTHINKRVPSATGSDHSSGTTTPIQDPPMEFESPGGKLWSSYPPSLNTQSDCIPREWLIQPADYATVAAASRSGTTTLQEKECHISSAVSILTV